MATDICNVMSIISSANIFDSITSCDKALTTYRQHANNVALLAAPLLLIQIANYTFEAESAINLSQSLSTGKQLVGLTKTLRPYRQQVNSISASLQRTAAAKCADVATLPLLYDSNSVQAGTFRQIHLNESGKIIADTYGESIGKCFRGPVARLRAKVNQLSQMKQKLQSDFVDKAQTRISSCSESWVDEEKLLCYENFINEFKAVFANFSKIYGVEAASDVFSVDYLTEDLSFVANCLLYANIDTAVAANLILREIKMCASNAGVDVAIQELSVLESTYILTSLYSEMSQFYSASGLNAATQAQQVFLKFLNNELRKADVESTRYPDSAESFLGQRVAASTSNEKCVRNGLASVNAALNESKVCVELFKQSIASLIKTLSDFFIPNQPRVNPLSYPGLKRDSSYQRYVDDIVFWYREGLTVESCRFPAKAYEPFGQCNILPYDLPSP